MMLDTNNRKFLKGGRSSHHWNWTVMRLTSVKAEWFASQDSEEAYDMLKSYRENVNYTHNFTDPEIHPCLGSDGTEFEKRLRTYREDKAFFYTYLHSHLTLAYPTRLIFYLDLEFSRLELSLSGEQKNYAKKLWGSKSRCPFT